MTALPSPESNFGGLTPLERANVGQEFRALHVLKTSETTQLAFSDATREDFKLVTGSLPDDLGAPRTIDNASVPEATYLPPVWSGKKREPRAPAQPLFPDDRGSHIAELLDQIE